MLGGWSTRPWPPSRPGSTTRAPRERGRLELVVRRPRPDEREVLVEGVLSCADGLVGDSWRARGSRRTADGAAHPDMQLNVMGARVAALVAGGADRRPLAGDQLYVDLDLSEDNLRLRSRLQIGSALIEVTDQPTSAVPSSQPASAATPCGSSTPRPAAASASVG